MNKSCILRVLDEVNIKFDGLDGPNGATVRRSMVNALKFEIPGARFMPAVKLGRWDGKESFCTVGGASFINTLDILLPIVEKAGYEIELEDLRSPIDINFDTIDKDLFNGRIWPAEHEHGNTPIVLRDYQVDAINKYLKNIQCIQEISTAAGKTIITAGLSYIVEKTTGGRSIIIVPNKNLVGQTEEDFLNIGLDVGVYFGDRKDIGKQHTICTWQSLEVLHKKGTIENLNLIEAFLEDVNCVIVDECHGAKAKIMKKLLTGPFRNVPIRWGLTGTIPEEDFQKVALHICIGETINQLTAKELQDKGILAQCHVNVVQLQDRGEYRTYAEELKYLVSNPARMKFIADSIIRIAESGNTFVLVDRLKAGELLEEFIENSVFLSGADKTSVRKEHFDKINKSDNGIVIATYGIASTGINIPRIFNLVMIEPGKSYIRVIQSIGRGIRKAKDKEFVNIWDFTSSLKFSKRHLGKRKSFYKKVSYPHSVTKVNY